MQCNYKYINIQHKYYSIAGVCLFGEGLKAGIFFNFFTDQFTPNKSSHFHSLEG